MARFERLIRRRQFLDALVQKVPPVKKINHPIHGLLSWVDFNKLAKQNKIFVYVKE